jgi:hypothetical protein
VLDEIQPLQCKQAGAPEKARQRTTQNAKIQKASISEELKAIEIRLDQTNSLS